MPAKSTVVDSPAEPEYSDAKRAEPVRHISWFNEPKKLKCESDDLQFDKTRVRHICRVGGSQLVTEIRVNKDNSRIAMKGIFPMDAAAANVSLKQIKECAKVRHPCIIHTLGYFPPTETEPGGIIMELEKMDLAYLMAKVRSEKKTPTEEQKRIIILGIVLGMR